MIHSTQKKYDRLNRHFAKLDRKSIQQSSVSDSAILFTVAPILAGLDKFFHLLVNWDQYLPPIVNNLTAVTAINCCCWLA
jgi:hypothetical protein